LVLPAEGDEAFVIGPFRLDERNRSLSRAGVPIVLGKRALDVLFVLAQAAGEIVGKQELLDRAWPGLIVEENNLQVQISAVRKALGDGFIVTVPGRGYRLVPTGTTNVSAVGSADRPSIVVLPFKNMSGDAGQEYIADGMSEDIITALSRVRPLFVIARNSSLAYKGKAVDVRQLGAALGVRYLVEGGIRRDNDRIRVTAQLVDAEADVSFGRNGSIVICRVSSQFRTRSRRQWWRRSRRPSRWRSGSAQ
jgi:TolB-like protein